MQCKYSNGQFSSSLFYFLGLQFFIISFITALWTLLSEIGLNVIDCLIGTDFHIYHSYVVAVPGATLLSCKAIPSIAQCMRMGLLAMTIDCVRLFVCLSQTLTCIRQSVMIQLQSHARDGDIVSTYFQAIYRSHPIHFSNFARSDFFTGIVSISRPKLASKNLTQTKHFRC